MGPIFEQYGNAIIAVTVVTALAIVIGVIIGTDANGIVGNAFKELITDFYSGV